MNRRAKTGRGVRSRCKKSGAAQSKGGVCGGGVGTRRVMGKDPEKSGGLSIYKR